MYMKKRYIIHQKQININPNMIENQMILLFTMDDKIICSCTIPFPSWHKFFDGNYPYCPLCLN
jgi:hypothetical protein